MEENNRRFSWGYLFIILLLMFFFILILLWLYPRNTVNSYGDRVFNENIEIMKDAARNYFTVDNLPKKNGESIKLTLEDMIDKRMVLPIKDKNGNTCNIEDSYVKAKRVSSDKYELKVSLTCGNETNYIIDTIGCYDVCNGNSCGDKNSNIDTPSFDSDKMSNIQYEFRRPITKDTYTCDAGYVLIGGYCYKSSIEDKVKATVTVTPSTTKTTDAKTSSGGNTKVYTDPSVKTTYVCSKEFDNAGTYTKPTTCTKSGSKSEAARVQVLYICNGNYDNAGTYTYEVKCYKNASVKKDAVKNTTYTCGSEYDNAGTYTSPTTCKKTTSATKSSSTTYTCGSEYDNAGTYTSPTTCKKTTSATKSSSTTYTCGSEYDNAGTYTNPTTCVKTAAASSHTSTSDGYYTNWSCGSCRVKNYNAPKSSTSTTRYESKGTTTKYVCSSSYCPGYITVYKYIVYTRSWVNGSSTTTYTCGSEYDNAGTYTSPTTCKKTTSATKSSSTTYTCGSGYDNAGTYTNPTTCVKTTKASSSTKVSYTCDGKYDNAGTYTNPTTCKKTTNSVIKTTYTCDSKYDNAGTYANPTTCVKNSKQTDESIKRVLYICSSAYDNAGIHNNPTTCVRKTSVSVDATVETKSSCPKGYTKSGEEGNVTCSKTIKTPGKLYCPDKSAKLVGNKCVKTIPEKTVETCPKEYNLTGGYCIKYNNEKKAATRDCIVDHYEYKWSNEFEIKGWSRTGRYRATIYDANLEQEIICDGCNCKQTTIKDDEDCNTCNEK